MMRKFYAQFTEKNLTGNAGLTHLGRFAEKLGLPQMLRQHISINRAENAKYEVADVIMMVVMGVLAGAKHISHMAIIRTDSAIRSLFNWKQFPDDTTLGRIFKLFGHKNCQELSEVECMAREKAWSKKWFGRLTLDMDSTVRGVYGSQQGAEKGYNPKKKGQKSYHPLLCFIAENRECLNNWFRSGAAYSANGCVEFMKECFAKLPKRVWSIAVRADSAFFNGDLLEFLENKGAQYLIKVKMKGLEALLEAQLWKKIKNRPGFEKAEFSYKCQDWKRRRRFVAIRQVKEYESEDILFPGTKIVYDYFCYVTNKNLAPWAAHKYYGKRATSENWIEWCKRQMASGSILTQDFWANSAIFQTCIIAYNLMVWMMWLNDEEGFKEEPNTVRMFLIHVPARLVYRGRQWFLKLSLNYPFKERWLSIENSIQALDFS
jgi:hypothetical protein